MTITIKPGRFSTQQLKDMLAVNFATPREEGFDEYGNLYPVEVRELIVELIEHREDGLAVLRDAKERIERGKKKVEFEGAPPHVGDACSDAYTAGLDFALTMLRIIFDERGGA